AALAAGEEAAHAPAEGVLDARQPGAIVERGDLVGAFARDPMDHAEMTVAARQQRGRAVFAETFVSGSVRRPFGAHAGDEKGMPVMVLAGGDAQGVAHATAGAVSGYDQACGDFAFAAAIDDADAARTLSHAAQTDKAGRTIAPELPEFRQPRFQRFAEVA